jgi:hypothetical protein
MTPRHDGVRMIRVEAIIEALRNRTSTGAARLGSRASQFSRLTTDQPTGHVLVVHSPRCRDDPRAEVFRELDRETGDASCAALNQNGFARLKSTSATSVRARRPRRSTGSASGRRCS